MSRWSFQPRKATGLLRLDSWCRARTRVDAQQGVDQLLGGTVCAVGGRRGPQAVTGPAGLELLLWDGPCERGSKEVL